MKTFTTQIQGIPCQVRVTHYIPPVYQKFGGAMEDSDEDEPVEFEYDIFDMHNNLFPQLKDMITDDDDARLMDEYVASVVAEKWDVIF